MRSISAIIACYRDEQAIPIMHRRLTDTFNKIGVDYEIIFVNDGSPDNTEEVLRSLAEQDPHVIAINHSRNFNSQMAFTSGMEIASGDAIVLLDGDLQDPPELIEDFHQRWVEGFDVVYGIRVKREAPMLMQVAYKLFYRVFHKMSYIRIPLDAGDFSLMDRKVVEALRQLPERDRFIRGLRAWVGYRQTGVPYVRPERMFGMTTNSFIKNIQWASKGIFSFSYAPLQMMTGLAMIVFLLSLVGIVAQIIGRIMMPHTPQGATTILVVIMFLGGIQLLCFSVLGEYIGKIFEEVKQRPQFIVKSIFRTRSTL